MWDGFMRLFFQHGCDMGVIYCVRLLFLAYLEAQFAEYLSHLLFLLAFQL